VIRAAYPGSAAARDRFVAERRAPRPARNPWQAPEILIEDEPDGSGTLTRGATLFLTGAECPWRCVMCDLWQQTTVGATPPGAIPAQVVAGRRRANAGGQVAWLKLYNAGSFFDARAVPEDDYLPIASALAGVPHVIVESHPALIGDRTARWLDALDRQRHSSRPATTLEVAMGLETAHPAALERLNKRMTVERFMRAAEWLANAGVELRVFLLVSVPFIPAARQDEWLGRSIDIALACRPTAISLIPTRAGNGALEALADAGQFLAPRLSDLERSFDLALARRVPGVRIFADTWDLVRASGCTACRARRRDRLIAMNATQHPMPRIGCAVCDDR
jgi:radical SAM enzyme (TIGR01210 family)